MSSIQLSPKGFRVKKLSNRPFVSPSVRSDGLLSILSLYSFFSNIVFINVLLSCLAHTTYTHIHTCTHTNAFSGLFACLSTILIPPVSVLCVDS
ncbi:hypothetical protein F5H01DRAFT_357139 [Linnemannia elongata]|nr:hypothetical protein F5H01DRAFT_357139 [Linnemannia elongata]